MCGVFGIRSAERDVARLSYFGLFALQHRGQEAAGIAVSDRGRRPCSATWGSWRRCSMRRSCRRCRAGRDRAHPLLDDRLERVGERAAARRRRTRTHGRDRPQRQPDEYEPAADRARRRPDRARRTSDTEAIAALIVHDPLRSLKRWRRRCHGSRAPIPSSRSRGEAARVPRSAGDPPARARPSGRRLGGRLGDVRVRPDRRRLRTRRPPRRARRHRRGRRARDPGGPGGKAGALHLRARLLRSARRDARRLRGDGVRVRMGEGLARRGAGRGGPRDADPRSGTPAAVGFTPPRGSRTAKG